MGAFLEKPKVDKHSESGKSDNGLRFALSSMQGWRIEMEDAHTAILSISGFPTWSFFGVYDGHAGSRVSAYCSTNLLPAIMDQLNQGNITEETEKENSDALKEALRTGFLQLDEKMRQLPEVLSGVDKSGSTAVCCLLTPKNLYFANCGDSRAVLSRAGQVLLKTFDHKPVNPIEKERIQKAGGSVMIQRVNGSLAVSRALGDFEYKMVQGKGQCEQLVSPEPEISVVERSSEDEFAILACDGVWDVMSNEEVCDFVRHELPSNPDLESICSQLMDVCLYKGSRDNMSVVLVTFPGSPQLCEKAAQERREVNEYIVEKVKTLVKEGQTELSELLQNLAEDTKIADSLPPGIGIHAKRSIIEAEFRKLVPQDAA